MQPEKAETQNKVLKIAPLFKSHLAHFIFLPNCFFEFEKGRRKMSFLLVKAAESKMESASNAMGLGEEEEKKKAEAEADQHKKMKELKEKEKERDRILKERKEARERENKVKNDAIRAKYALSEDRKKKDDSNFFSFASSAKEKKTKTTPKVPQKEEPNTVCFVPGCGKETSIIQPTCDFCHQAVCHSHRTGGSHNCQFKEDSGVLDTVFSFWGNGSASVSGDGEGEKEVKDGEESSWTASFSKGFDEMSQSIKEKIQGEETSVEGGEKPVSGEGEEEKEDMWEGISQRASVVKEELSVATEEMGTSIATWFGYGVEEERKLQPGESGYIPDLEVDSSQGDNEEKGIPERASEFVSSFSSLFSSSSTTPTSSSSNTTYGEIGGGDK